MCLLAALGIVVLGCSPSAAGWRDPGVHLVDGTWITTEHDCASGDPGEDLECRTVRDETLALLPPDVRARVTRAAVADLPTHFITGTGERREARLRVGLSGYKAVVVDLSDGERRVVGAACYLPYDGDGRLRRPDVRCEPIPLSWWLEGGAPPSIPPGTVFG
jgi:hypothetical protein